MSRIGRKLITIPAGVEVIKNGFDLSVKGSLGQLVVKGHPKINYLIENGKISVERKGNDKLARSLHGLYRSLTQNAIVGVDKGFQKKLEMNGVGYRAILNGDKLELSVGFSHPVNIEAPEGISFHVEKNTQITVKGIDKQLVGEISAKIRKIRPPEPYKGKGIKYSDEIIKRKAGKTAKAGA